MAEKMLTERQVATALIFAGEKFLNDGGGLYLRLRPGKKDWVFRYQLAGIRQKTGLGSYPVVGLKAAREKAAELRILVAEGKRPVEEKRLAEIERKAAVVEAEALPQTVKELFKLWEEKELPRRKDGGQEARRKFEKDVFPKVGDLRLDQLKRAHIVAVLDNVRSRGAGRVAGMLLAELRQMFSFALLRDLLPVDPSFGLRKADWGGIAVERDRVLSEAEIKQLHSLLPGARMINKAESAIWICLSTCCRIGELTSASWEHVDLEAGTWFLPETKNSRSHTIFLSDFALSHFKDLLEYAKTVAEEKERQLSAWVLPARHHEGFVCPKTLAKQIGDRQRPGMKPMKGRSPYVDALLLPGGKWTPHDLRRTGATMMAALGVRPDVIEHCLNHVEPNKVKRIYQRYSYEPEMKAAWRLLGERLELLKAPAKNVVTLSAA